MTAQNDLALASSGTKVVQITNIAPQATKDQMHSLFGFLGKIEDIRLYPTIRDVSVPVQSRICYVKFFDQICIGVAQHMTNTVFIDRALIVTPYQTSTGDIPDEYRALDIAAQANIVPGLYPSDPKLPPHVTNQIEGIPPNQVITTHDPLLVSNGLPPYPPLPVTYDARRIEEIRRTLLVINIDESISAQQLIDFFATAGDVKYVRFCTRDNDSNRYSLVEFSEQSSIIPGLKMNGTELAGKMIQVYHATQAIAKPMAKSNEAAQREIEEAMTRVKEAQSLISAAIDPVIGILSKDKKRSRSGSKSRRSRSRSRGRRHRRSRSRSRHRSRHHRRSRSHSRRSRSRSKPSRSRRSRSRDKRKRSKDRKKSRSRSRSRGKHSRRSTSRRRTRSKSKSHTSRSRSERSRSTRKSKDRDRKKEKDKKSEDIVKTVKSRDTISKTSSSSENKDSYNDKRGSDSKKAKSPSNSPEKKAARSRSLSRDSGSPNRRSSSVSPGRRRSSHSPIKRSSRSPSRSPVRQRSHSPRKSSCSPSRKRRSRSSSRKGSRSPGRYRGSQSVSPPSGQRSGSGSP